MKEEIFRDLNRGDLIKHRGSPDIFVVTGNYGGRVTAVKTVDMTNPPEWELVRKAFGKVEE